MTHNKDKNKHLGEFHLYNGWHMDENVTYTKIGE